MQSVMLVISGWTIWSGVWFKPVVIHKVMVTVYAVHTQCRLGLCVQQWPLFSVQPNRTSTLTTVKLSIPKYFSCDCDDQIIIIQYRLWMKNSRKSNRTMQSILSFGRNWHDRFLFFTNPKAHVHESWNKWKHYYKQEARCSISLNFSLLHVHSSAHLCHVMLGAEASIDESFAQFVRIPDVM